MRPFPIAILIFCLLPICKAETLPPLEGGKAPQTVDELWGGFDPRAEPLEIEVLKEWEEDGVVMRVLRYRIGVFKGRKAMMAAIYGFPKAAKSLPGLVQIHGGGQYADHRAVLSNAKRGYATISIAWAGRISSPDYRVGPAEVKLFWDGAEDQAGYRLTTDWGALDGYHAPGRNPGNHFPNLHGAADWTLDLIESPRNNGWFLCALGARRALTFLEQQAEVDAQRLGVYGHSMGGKLTVLTTGADDRVKAAAPSCGGVSDRTNANPLFRATLGDDVYLRRIRCPIVFLMPSNDFHGRIDDLQAAVSEIGSKHWRVTCSPHSNHQDTSEYEVATQLWFDQHLKGSFAFPATPEADFAVDARSGLPSFAVRPDRSRPVQSVQVFYTQQGQIDAQKNDRINTIHQFWHYAPAREQPDGSWTADLPLFSTDLPVWVYANVSYGLEKPVSGAGYYYGAYTADRFNLSSRMAMRSPSQLKEAGAKASLEPSVVIEDFEGDWKPEWFTYRPQEWPLKTHKVYHPMWSAPEGSRLALEVRSEEANQLVIGIDDYAVAVALAGGGWQEIELSPGDFKNASGGELAAWAGIRELRLGHRETLRDRKRDKVLQLGGQWRGAPPEFRSLRWSRPAP